LIANLKVSRLHYGRGGLEKPNCPLETQGRALRA